MDDNDLRFTSVNSMRADASLSTDMSCENKKEKEAEKGKDYNDTFMELAFTSAEEALRRQEVPVGCVFVLEGREVVAVGRNRVNETKNACLHAEFVCLDQVLESHGRHVLNSIDVYVTVEPCIMCASMLAQVGVRKIVYGAPNERFGGLGSVLNVLSSEDSQAPPSSSRAGSSSRSSIGNVRSTSGNASGTAMTCITDATSASVVAAAAGTVTSATCPIEIVSAVQKERAIQLLKLFYQGENPNAPQPKPKRKAASKTSDDADSGRSLIGSISNSNSNNNNNNNSNSTSSSTSNSNHNNSTSNLSSDTHSHVSSVVTPPTNEK